VPTRACFSLDGRWLASMAQDDDRLILWDGQTGAQQREYAARENSPFAFTADSRHFLAGPRGASVVGKFECETGVAVSGFESAWVWPLLAHPDGDRVFTTSTAAQTPEQFFKHVKPEQRLECWLLPARGK